VSKYTNSKGEHQMSKFLKHIGKMGDRKVAVIFRQIPGDEHMALVVYTETLNQNVHDPMMTAIESPQGQEAVNLGEALNRAYTQDGKVILQMLHAEGMMKKAQTAQVIMTPTPNVKSHIRLNELNDLLNEMEKGEEAVKRLAEIDASRGLQDPKDVARRVREGERKAEARQATPPLAADPSGFIGDNQMANNLREQAMRMASEAKGLMAEADRLIREASQLDPVPVAQPAKRTRAKATLNTTVVAEQAPVKRAGRAKKASVAG
jgi:hypothetical protein